MDDLIGIIVDRLAEIPGVVAVALGGSRARGSDRPDSDYDLGLYYQERSPFAVAAVRDLADEINDTPRPVVTDFGGWGRWVNGGAWLTVQGQRVDFLYRSLDDVARVIDDCRQGRIESDWHQQPPYGFHSYVYLGEIDVCRPLDDPAGVLRDLKRRLVPYPPLLKQAIVNRFLWGVEFTLPQAAGFAGRGDVYNAAGCLIRCAAALVQALYALNEHYFLTDKGALDEIESFELRPAGFSGALTGVLARPGGTAGELAESVAQMQALFEAVAAHCGDLYQRPQFRAGEP